MQHVSHERQKKCVQQETESKAVKRQRCISPPATPTLQKVHFELTGQTTNRKAWYRISHLPMSVQDLVSDKAYLYKV